MGKGGVWPHSRRARECSACARLGARVRGAARGGPWPSPGTSPAQASTRPKHQAALHLPPAPLGILGGGAACASGSSVHGVTCTEDSPMRSEGVDFGTSPRRCSRPGVSRTWATTCRTSSSPLPSSACPWRTRAAAASARAPRRRHRRRRRRRRPLAWSTAARTGRGTPSHLRAPARGWLG